MLARGHGNKNGRRVLVFAALGFMSTVSAAVIAVGTGCLGARPGSEVRGTQARDPVANHTDETPLKAMAEADEAPQVRPTPEGAWANGVFTTMAKPVAPTPPVVVQPPAAPAPPEVVTIEVPTVVQQPIPSMLLWVVVIIGAVLVIALIILIVRTRRIT